MKTYINEGSDEIRYAISEAIFTLLKTHSYDEIKVVDIIKTAAVGKTTFYRYYGNKSAKRDALSFNLQEGFRRFQCAHPDIVELDKQFGSYLYESEGKIKMLHREKCFDIIDDLILSVYGPKSDDPSELMYLKYAGAGLWMGVIRAILANDFQDDIATIQKKMMLGFFSQGKKQ